MKKNITILGAVLVLATAFTACHDEFEDLDGQGTVYLTTKINSDIKIQSRADISDYADNCLIYISNKKGLVRRYKGIGEVPADGIQLVSDHYIAEGWAGDSVSASFDKKWFKGRTEFDVTKGATTQVDLTCSIANVLTSVNYDAVVGEILTDYKMTIGHSKGSLEFGADETRTGYFMMPSTDKDLTWEFTGKLANGDTYTRKGTITNAKPATQYILNVKYTGHDDPIGGGYFVIEIDENPVVVNDVIVISIAPEIEGYDFDITQPVAGEPGNVRRTALYITASTSLTSLELSSSIIAGINGVGGSDVDLFKMSETIKQALEAGGINYIYNYDADKDISWIKINFEPALLNTLAEGEYTVNVKATDANDKVSNGTLTFNISNAPVAPTATIATEIWPTQATIYGSILKEGTASPVMVYRAKGASVWTEATTTADGNKLTATITGLTPGTTYEYAVQSGDYISATMTFTTESAQQLVNGGFEGWNTSKAPYLLYADGQEMWWDSGNHGSATMSKNITTPDSDIKVEGNYSAKLASQFVGIGKIGKFAAGNAFVGKYLATDGTDGILGWGRPFGSRPKALKGYVKYTPGNIEYVGNGAPSSVAKGDLDNGIIYIALLTGHTESYSSESFPVIVKTKSGERQLFDKNASNVIAYGEKIFTAATDGDGMIEFEIPLEYFQTNVKVSNIMIVCSSSRYGDYFTGGTSTMWIDDFKLVY